MPLITSTQPLTDLQKAAMQSDNGSVATNDIINTLVAKANISQLPVPYTDAQALSVAKAGIPANILTAPQVDQMGSITGYDIILIAGQSNSQGNAAGTQLSDPNIFQFDGTPASATYQTIIAAADPLKNPGTATGSLTTSLNVRFAKQYLLENPGRIPLLVPCAWGGTALVGGPWSPLGADPGTNAVPSNATAGSLYWFARHQLEKAMAAVITSQPGSRFVGTLWLQGESDSTADPLAYATNLEAVIAGFRSLAINGAATSWFIINPFCDEVISTAGGTAPATTQNFYAIDLAQKDVAGRNARVAFTPSIGTGYQLDALHYNGAGLQVLGDAAYVSVGNAKKRTVGARVATPFNLQTSYASDNSVLATWSAGLGGGVVTDYLIEYSLDLGATWVALVRPASTRPSATAGILPSATSGLLRVTAKGASGYGAPSASAPFTTLAAFTQNKIRLSTLAAVTESGDATAGYSYSAANGVGPSNSYGIVSDRKIAANTNGAFSVTLAGTFGGHVQRLIVRDNNSATYALAQIMQAQSPAYQANGPSTYPQVCVTGDIMRMRKSSGAWVAEVASAATPTLFVIQRILPATANSDAFPGVSFYLTAGGRTLGNLTGYNTVAAS